MIEISPSLLPLANDVMFEYANKAVELGVPRLHLDIIDGQFVNKHGLPDDIVKTVLENFHHAVNVDVHLMVKDPLTYILKPYYALSSKIYVHIQNDKAYEQSLYETIHAIGCEPGLVISPDEAIDHTLDTEHFKSILMMGVVPGLSGQAMLPNTLPRIQQLKTLINQASNDNYHITLDGGVTKQHLLQLNGQIDCCVMGAAIFNHPDWESELNKLLIAVK